MQFFRIALVVLIFGVTASAQDLNQLRERVSQFWALRLQNNKLDALPFVEAQSRRSFLAVGDNANVAFKISGFEFSADPNHIEVLLQVRSQVSNVGEFEHLIRESWIWTDGAWQWKQSVPADDPFTSLKPSGAPADTPPLPEFRLADKGLDFGRHVQGDQVEVRLRFVAKRDDVQRISPAEDIPGLLVTTPIWTSETEGYITLKWDTALVWQNLNKELTLRATFVNDATAVASVFLTSQIDGRVAFKQVPAVIDPSTSGQVEIEITNLSKSTPLSVVSAWMPNEAYTIDEDVPTGIGPGRMGRLTIRYKAQAEFRGAAVQLTMQGSLTLPGVTFPLQVKLTSQAAPPPYSREEIERALRNRSTPSLPR